MPSIQTTPPILPPEGSDGSVSTTATTQTLFFVGLLSGTVLRQMLGDKREAGATRKRRQGEAGRRVRQSSGLSSAACWPLAMLLGHTALSLYLTPRVTALPLCGRLRCTEWAAANDQQANASVMCFNLSMTTIRRPPDNSSHRYRRLATRHVPPRNSLRTEELSHTHREA